MKYIACFVLIYVSVLLAAIQFGIAITQNGLYIIPLFGMALSGWLLSSMMMFVVTHREHLHKVSNLLQNISTMFKVAQKTGRGPRGR